jgi:hypothetical protein
MENRNKSLSTNEAWRMLVEKYDIINHIKKDGVFHIKASQIKEFREPRLMAKWDSSDSLPEILRLNKINILPDSRSSYLISDYILYEDIPELEEHVNQMDHVSIPEYESVDINNINSETNAINVLILSGILDDFLQTSQNVSTFNGRMGTGKFDFNISSFSGNKRKVSVNNAQCEIDGGFENDESVIIMEAKNVVHEDFHVRQLYYPYRLWLTKVSKPIRLIFSIYSNKIYRLFEYRFRDINDYSSIELVQMKNYSLQNTNISLNDLIEIRNMTVVKTDDNQDTLSRDSVPFIQANSLDRIISLLENLYDNPMSPVQITELMQFDIRQSDYYFNAGSFLGIFTKVTDDKQKIVELTPLGNELYKLNYKNRQLNFVSLILKHQIFADLFDYMIENGETPSNKEIENKMRILNVCNEGQIVRRANSVLGWLRWIFNLTKL